MFEGVPYYTLIALPLLTSLVKQISRDIPTLQPAGENKTYS